MQVLAKLNKASISAQKARLVIDQIRSLPVSEAVNILKFSNKKAAFIVKKLVESAINNAENNEGADIDELRISAAYVDEAQKFKRIMPRAKGRANRIVKQTCHITIKLTDIEE